MTASSSACARSSTPTKRVPQDGVADQHPLRQREAEIDEIRGLIADERARASSTASGEETAEQRRAARDRASSAT